MFACVRTPVESLVRQFDASRLSPGEARQALEELAEIRNVVDALILKVGKRVEDTGAHAAKGERSAATYIARTLGTQVGHAHDVLRTARELESLPIVDEAVRAGRLSSQEAKLIVGAAAVNPDAAEHLLDKRSEGMAALRDACIAARAEVEDPATRRKRQKSSRMMRVYTDDDGMLAGRFRLVPEVGARFKALLEDTTQRIFRARRPGQNHEPLEAYAADAFLQLVFGDGSPRKGVDVRMHVIVDHGTLTGKYLAENPVCEIAGVGPVDVEWVRSLLGSAFLTAVIKKGKDITTVAHLGRHIPVEIQTGLVVEGHECGIRGCGMRGYLERDHRHDFAKGGPTSLSNLGWLCWYHHQLKSRGWILGPPDPKTGKCDLSPPPATAA